MNRLKSAKHFIFREYKILIFFIFVFALMTPYYTLSTTSRHYFPDECDNLLGGRIISEGGVLYRDYITQHTPVPYYLMALFAKIGITSVIGARILFYAIIVMFFVTVYFRYKKYFGAKTLLIFPVVFVLDISRHWLMWCILGDMFQAMALLALFMEFYVFCTVRPRKLTMSNVVIISLSIFAAIGSAFLSVYAIAAVLLGVFISEIERAFSKRRAGIKEIFSRYMPLAIALGILVVIYFGYFAINHALKEMIYQTYTFNREVYPRYYYMPGVIEYLPYAISQYAIHVFNSFKWLLTLSLSAAVSVLLIICNAVSCFLFMKKSKALGISAILFTICTGMRGYTGFHSTAYIMFSSFCLAYTLEHFVFLKMNIMTLAITVFVGILAFAPSYAANLKKINDLPKVFDPPAKNYYIEKYVPKGGYFFCGNDDLSFNLIYDVKLPSRLPGLWPWYGDVFMPSTIEEFERNKPNVIFYNPDFVMWGLYKSRDCYQMLEELLQRDYVNYLDSEAAFEYADYYSDYVWVHKDVGVEPIKSIKRDKSYKSSSNEYHVGGITKDIVIKQTFLSNENNLCGIWIMFATFTSNNTSTINLKLYDENEVLIAEETIQTAAMKACAYLPFNFTGINDSLGRFYTLVVSSEDAVPGNAVTIWLTNKESFNGDLLINDQEQEYNLSIIPWYNR